MIIKKIGKAVQIILLVAICVVYAGVLIPPDVFWPFSVISYLIPFVLAVHCIMLIWLAIRRKKIALLYLVSLICAWPLIKVTYNFTSQEDEGGDTEGLSIMSFNTKLFRAPYTYHKFSLEMIDWVVADSSDIKCIQEFSYNQDFPKYDVVSKLTDRGYDHYKFVIQDTHNPGIAIFSKYPIIARGTVDSTNQSVNNMIFADIKYENDTIRVYNVHLSSMRIELSRYKEPENVRFKAKDLANKMRYGAIVRSKQIEALLTHVSRSPYPVIICGDFNETPYSYNYFNLKSSLENAFEEKGNGFGFSYNHSKLPIRIDHQFFQFPITIQSYKIDRSMKISDHFPTRAVYQLVDQ